MADLGSSNVFGDLDVTGNITGKVTPKTTSTGSAVVPAGTTAQRDAAPVAGYFRFNADSPGFEGYNGTEWGEIGGGAIIEQGSNANGDYIKFADGTLLMGGTYQAGITMAASGVTGLNIGEITITLPSTPILTGLRLIGISGNNNLGHGWGGKSSTIFTVSTIYCKYWSTSATSTSSHIHWEAIGRWF